MKYEIYISIDCEIFSFPESKLIKAGEAVDELQARAQATIISGVSFLDVKDLSNIKVKGYSATYSVKVTDTTSFLLRIKE